MDLHAVPNDELFPDQWHMTTVQAEDAWNETTGTGVKVAVIDSGLTDTKPLGGDGIGCIVDPYNAVDISTDVTDIKGHGTHVAGL